MTPEEELATWRRFVEQKIKAHDDKLDDLEKRVTDQNAADVVTKAIAEHEARQRVRDIALGGVGVGVIGLVVNAITGG